MQREPSIVKLNFSGIFGLFGWIFKHCESKELSGLSQSFQTIRNTNAWNFRNDVLEEPFYPDFFVNHAHIQTDETVSLDSGIIDEMIAMDEEMEGKKPDDQKHINDDVSTKMKDPFFISRHQEQQRPSTGERLKNYLSIEDKETVTDSPVINENQYPCIFKEATSSSQKNEEPISDDDKAISCSEEPKMNEEEVNLRCRNNQGKSKFRNAVQKLIEIQRNVKLLNGLKNDKKAVERPNEDEKNLIGFQGRKQMKEEFPDLKSPNVAMAAVKIQKVYRRFQARQKGKELNVVENDVSLAYQFDLESKPQNKENDEKHEKDKLEENTEIKEIVHPTVTESMTENSTKETKTEALESTQPIQLETKKPRKSNFRDSVQKLIEIQRNIKLLNALKMDTEKASSNGSSDLQYVNDVNVIIEEPKPFKNPEVQTISEVDQRPSRRLPQRLSSIQSSTWVPTSFSCCFNQKRRRKQENTKLATAKIQPSPSSSESNQNQRV